MGYETPTVPPPKDYKGDFFKGKIMVGLQRNSCTVYIVSHCEAAALWFDFHVVATQTSYQ
jgi:hypothetical protein